MPLLPSCRDNQSVQKQGRDVLSNQKVDNPLRAREGAPNEKAAPLPKDLEELQQRFLLTIREKKADLFLRFVSEGGMYLGVDGEKLPKSNLARQIKMKKGVYCLLFDSACLKAETHKESCSYSQLMSDADELKAGTTLGNYKNTPQAEIIVSVRGHRCETYGVQNLNFIFNKEPSGWRLVAVPYP